MPIENSAKTRLVILLREDQKKKLTQIFPWGDLSEFYRQLTDDLLELMKTREDAMKIHYAYMNRKVKLQDMSPMIRGELPDDQKKNS